ncbi:MAG: hypothetical protein A2117_01290 [Candidatus Wildermuthbacteria bacterium GWA2_46_15]|uniref:DUF262 domain-containing protein n=1 Tax=Candidatus Wildermuthbacteria bacterium GWA2_46_15 TaxID=1802443 RepID=A0A1G2QS56_9BACT|nr:MAG: hypothetical protein A2117_01290 [Candidatus Wildermuthbacteria bacterium GWA2_46_15]
MNNKTLTSLFSEYLYQIPDYQRGYAWEEKQWKDFIQDIDALVEDKVTVTSHYTGTVVVYAGRNAKVADYGTRQMKVVDVVDGQQRLTTSCLYLSVIIRALQRKGETAYEHDISDFLYTGAICKLTLNNDTGNIFYDLLKTGRTNTSARSPHEKRLIAAYNRFQQHISDKLEKLETLQKRETMQKLENKGVAYLKDLLDAITRKLHFTFYEIDDECEIGMTFELMNSRGKGLSVLELLKNYLMHWVSRNETNLSERSTMTALINKNWKDVYTNLGECAGDDGQCLRIAWTLYCNSAPKSWIGYDGFKGDAYIPLRNFTEKRTQAETRKFITDFADGLADISRHYANIINPTEKNKISADELLWLTKIRHTNNIANFLPLMVAARKHRENRNISENDYIAHLKALECFAYRVFLYKGRRGDVGKSKFYPWSNEVFTQARTLKDVTGDVHKLTRTYATEESFISGNAKPDNWYATRHRLRYTLFEYELYLLSTKGKDIQPHLKWEDLSDSTFEHILPQTPKEDSLWKEVWTTSDFTTCIHDIGNLVLTHDNSSYSNFEFSRKKGKPGQSPSYSNSDIRQEREISKFADWTRKEFDARRADFVRWINNRWKTVGDQGAASLEVVDEADEDVV